MLLIKKITKPGSEIEIAKALFNEYASELNEDLCFQHWEEELSNPLLKYGPPEGSLIMAYWENVAAGCIAIQPLKEQGLCEMKRLYVRPAYRRHGIGEELVKIILKEAIDKGYNIMVLDTLSRLTQAIKLYERYGFVHTSAYYDNPLDGVVYMEKALKES